MVAVVATVLYAFATLLSASAFPKRYGSWLENIRNLNRQEGMAGLPAFNAVGHYLGALGVGFLMLALLALVLSSLVGNIPASAASSTPWPGWRPARVPCRAQPAWSPRKGRREVREEQGDGRPRAGELQPAGWSSTENLPAAGFSRRGRAGRHEAPVPGHP